MTLVRRFLAVLALMVAAPALPDSAFCSGYKAGFKAGACYQQFGCLPPLPPLCPLPNIGENSYKDGYNRGFLDGLNH